jgi:hypothetical protein
MSADDLASCGFVYSWPKVPCHVLSDAGSVLRSLLCTCSPYKLMHIALFSMSFTLHYWYVYTTVCIALLALSYHFSSAPRSELLLGNIIMNWHSTSWDQSPKLQKEDVFCVCGSDRRHENALAKFCIKISYIFSFSLVLGNLKRGEELSSSERRT